MKKMVGNELSILVRKISSGMSAVCKVTNREDMDKKQGESGSFG
ncbi:hypothetical protein [Candidatus Enterococcus leclercqii]|nr:hypothetical protein [Enterococcus sp. CU9D]